MNDLQIYDYLRLLTAIMTIIAAWRLTNLVKKDHTTYSTKLAEWVWFIYAVLFSIFASSIEAVTRNAGYRYTTLLWFLITLAAIRASRDDGPLQKSTNKE